MLCPLLSAALMVKLTNSVPNGNPSLLPPCKRNDHIPVLARACARIQRFRQSYCYGRHQLALLYCLLLPAGSGVHGDLLHLPRSMYLPNKPPLRLKIPRAVPRRLEATLTDNLPLQTFGMTLEETSQVFGDGALNADNAGASSERKDPSQPGAAHVDEANGAKSSRIDNGRMSE